MEVLKLTDELFNEITNNKEKAVLVDFYADWCGPCRMQGPIVEEIAKENDDIIVGKINVDDYQEAAMKYHVQSIPTLLIFKNGQLVKSFIGVTGKESLLSYLK
ncbi:MAG: thioredoxin [Bacilli bacterium]|nr:thioredoxin [Bacilli bacterium]